MTPFTFNWRVRCKVLSLANEERYYVDLATGTDKAIALDLARELDRLGYIEVDVVLQTASLP